MARTLLLLCVVALLGLGCEHSPDVVANLTTEASTAKPMAGSTAEPVAGTMAGPVAGAVGPIMPTAGSSAPPPSAGSSALQAGSAAPDDPCARMWSETTYAALATIVNNQCRFGQYDLVTIGLFLAANPVAPPMAESAGPSECDQAGFKYSYQESPNTWRLCENVCRFLTSIVADESARRLMCGNQASD